MTPAGLAQLERDEGLRTVAYPDPVSHGEPFTIGYGHTGGIVPGQTCTVQQAHDWLAHDVANAEQHLMFALPWFSDLDPVRADVLTNIAFNIGVSGLLKWPTTLGHFRAHNWEAASHDLLTEGRWDTQVGDRAKRLAHATLTGAWA